MDNTIQISKMTGKMTDIPAINTNTLSNPFCIKAVAGGVKSICGSCFSWAMLNTFRASCVPAFQRNSEVLSRKTLHPDALPTTNAAFFRFSGHGEIINEHHARNFINIARHNPQTTFSLWTKRPALIKTVLAGTDKPRNLILIYSNPRIDKIIDKVPAGFDKVFNVVSGPGPAVNCKARCIDCLKCYKKSRAKKNNVIVEVLKVYAHQAVAA